MTATVVEIKESDEWVNLTAAASLQPGDQINVQNIGSGGSYLQTSVAEPADLSGIDYICEPKNNPLQPTPAPTESVWANTDGLGTTKLSVAETAVATITDPLLTTANSTSTSAAIARGVPAAAITGFSRYNFPEGTLFAFSNDGLQPIAADFLAKADNNSNSQTGSFDICVAVNTEAITGGTDFTTQETLQVRDPVPLTAKLNPTNTPDLRDFERVYVAANGGAGIETLENFIVNPGETIFVEIGTFTNITEASFTVRFNTI